MLGTWFYVSADFLFAFWWAKKQVINIDPFRPTMYVITGFDWLEVSNRVGNWNKQKKFNYVGSKFQLFQLELPLFIYKLMCQISLINTFSFMFWEYNRLGYWNVGKTTIIISKSQIEILFLYSRSRNFNVNMSCPSGNFETNLSTYVIGKSFWHYRELKIDCLTSRHILCKKIINTFVCVEVRILVEKWNIYEAHIFQRPLLQTRHIGNDFFLNNQLRVN